MSLHFNFHILQVCYQSGKGNNHLVPLLVPLDIVEGLRKLVDKSVRSRVGIADSNVSVFPSTNGSAGHVSGWHAVHKVCVEAGVRDVHRLTATKMRHRASTLYAAMDLPESERQHFYKHLGHSSAVNASVYQTPPAIAEVTKVGVSLQAMDHPGEFSVPLLFLFYFLIQ